MLNVRGGSPSRARANFEPRRDVYMCIYIYVATAAPGFWVDILKVLLALGRRAREDWHTAEGCEGFL